MSYIHQISLHPSLLSLAMTLRPPPLSNITDLILPSDSKLIRILYEGYQTLRSTTYGIFINFEFF